MRDMYCNVYFNSGFFYPKNEDDPIAKYDFKIESEIRGEPPVEIKREVWRRQEGGSYFPRYPVGKANFSSFAAFDSRRLRLEYIDTLAGYQPLEVYADTAIVDADEDSSQSRESLPETLQLGAHLLYRVDPRATRIATLEQNQATRILLKRKERERITFRSDVSSAEISTSIGRHIYIPNFVTIAAKSFVAEHLGARVTQTNSEYVIDILGYLSFAFGVTVYSLFVAPTTTIFFGIGRDLFTNRKSAHTKANSRTKSEPFHWGNIGSLFNNISGITSNGNRKVSSKPRLTIVTKNSAETKPRD
eukprot:Plantae.Rhodophyta-Hildenbrandia_rubra.ctg6290.p3 GENE.Plantae.Rhodophyta-Hildenbrandia_rubra.ctg6290~~Plantae.Rhodophyta-Hildenbrandia_rubra.ctg6290.p3  ORF type:complete len:303 (+),score=29.10 Plantae.Rhodophyta-Hildenbrandia_rubra.ctg6290:3467-4375(+)